MKISFKAFFLVVKKIDYSLLAVMRVPRDLLVQGKQWRRRLSFGVVQLMLTRCRQKVC